MKLKKIIERPISKEEIERLKWLHAGLFAIEEKARKAALERDLEFMEKKGKFITPEEFHSLLFSKEIKRTLIPRSYRQELKRYHDMLLLNIASILQMEELKNAEVGKMLGIPAAREHLIELKKGGRRLGFVYFDEKKKKLEFIANVKDLPKGFRKRLKR